MNSPSGAPPRLAAASERPTRLAGRPVSAAVIVPAATRDLLAAAAEPATGKGHTRRSRIYLNVEDIRAVANPGSVYGVYLNLPDTYTERVRDRHHVGNVTVFGVEAALAKDPQHEHVPGMRHTFDVTRKVRVLRRLGRLEPDRLVVTFLLELPVPPPGFRGNADQILRDLVDNARATPITVGRVSVFVG
jgi:tyrosinase